MAFVRIQVVGSSTWELDVVGIFDSAGSAFDSEIWADADQVMQSFRRQAYSSVVARIVDASAFDGIKARLEADPRLTLDVKRERTFFEEQSQALSNFIRYLGLTLSIIFSIGAMIGAMITMYGAVAQRSKEVGTLRALGATRGQIRLQFLCESLLLATLVACHRRKLDELALARVLVGVRVHELGAHA